tara:strand:- start:322 stop:864 length:543 start_codon:yes stop_codon:yes gene_type:complete
LDSDAKGVTLSNSCKIFAAVDASGSRDLNNGVIAEKIPFFSDGSLSEGYYAYWVEDEGVKADFSWHEGTFTDDDRKQAPRLSASPGVDYGVFASDATSPFNGLVAHPIEKTLRITVGSPISTRRSAPQVLPLVTGSSQDAVRMRLLGLKHSATTLPLAAVLCSVMSKTEVSDATSASPLR